VRVLAARTGLSRHAVTSILERLGAVKKFGEHVPRALTIKNKQQRRRAENLALLERDDSLLERAIAEDECWFYLYESSLAKTIVNGASATSHLGLSHVQSYMKRRQCSSSITNDHCSSTSCRKSKRLTLRTTAGCSRTSTGGIS
jgi:hypothetical protein